MPQTMSPVATHTLETLPAQVHAPAVSEAAHPNPTEEQVSRVVFMIIMGAAVLFIAAAIFVSHM